MTAESRVRSAWPTLLGAALVLVAVGAGGTYLGLRSVKYPGPCRETAMATPGIAAETATPAAPPGPRLGSDAGPAGRGGDAHHGGRRARRHCRVPSAERAPAGEGLRAPGVVQANAYRQVVVTPLVSGRVTRVAAELGQVVQRGQTIAQVFSPELAEAQTRYVAARAELGAHEQELARTEKLVAIGAASRQELERIHAEHTARRADLESAESRLRLLGLSAKAVDALAPGRGQEATVDVPAPIAGIVTERTANVGLNVESDNPAAHGDRLVDGVGDRRCVREGLQPGPGRQSCNDHDPCVSGARPSKGG